MATEDVEELSIISSTKDASATVDVEATTQAGLGTATENIEELAIKSTSEAGNANPATNNHAESLGLMQYFEQATNFVFFGESLPVHYQAQSRTASVRTAVREGRKIHLDRIVHAVARLNLAVFILFGQPPSYSVFKARLL